MKAILFQALVLFCSCSAVHVMVWRLFPVRSQGIRLGAIFVALPVACFGLLVGVLRVFGNSLPIGDSIMWGLVYIFHLSVSGSYMFFYTAVTGFSPSIAILEKVEASMPRGLKRNDLAPKWFTDANLSGARRENLLATGFIYETNGVLRLSGRGRLIAHCFLMFRRFLGLPDIGRG